MVVKGDGSWQLMIITEKYYNKISIDSNCMARCFDTSNRIVEYCDYFKNNFRAFNQLHKNQQKLMQIDSSPQQKIIQGQSVSFKIFNDGQFLRQKKQQTTLSKTKRKVIKSLNIYIATNYEPQHQEHKNHTKNPQEQVLQDFPLPTQAQPDEKTSGMLSDKKIAWENAKARLQSEKSQSRAKRYQQRYGESRNSQIKPQQSYDSSARQSNDNRIRVLKRIIEHYNTKVSDFKTNFVNKWNINFNNSNLLGPPKTAVRREKSDNKLSQIKHPSQKNVQSTTNNRRVDLFDGYFNPKKITVEAHGINELIRHKQSCKKRVSTSVNQRRNTKIGNYSNSPTKRSTQKYETLPTEPPKMVESYNQNFITTKVNKFRQFIFLLNCAHKMYRELDIPKYQHSFKIFIGKGNNSNLVRAIMKRRFWFQVTKNIQEAHFVWTQLKEEEMYERQGTLWDVRSEKKLKRLLQNRPSTSTPKEISSKDKNDDGLVQTNNTDSLEINLEDSVISSKIISLAKNTAREHKEQVIKVKRSRESMINRPEHRLLTTEQFIAYRLLLSQVGIRKKIVFRDRVPYLKDCSILDFDDLSSQLVHNHLPSNGLLGNKKAMFYMLREYYQLTQKSVFQVLPLTYHIRGLQDQQFKAFSLKFMQNRMSNHPNFWVIKPGEFSNRGQGIQCTNRLDQVKKRLNRIKNNKNKSLIVQQYITNPLLYNGRKFDIRTYMLISCNNGIMRGYWYQDGYVRTSSEIWSLEDMADSEVHLTNDSIQKYSDSYGRYEAGNKLTYTELQRYFDNLPRDITKPAVNFNKDIHPQIKYIAEDAIKSTFCYLDPSRKGDNFQIFGFDFMLDNKFKPWLIEINTNPCLEMSCPVLNRIIPSMLQNALRISLDPLFPVPLNYSSNYKYSIPENALHYNKFQLIFDEERDGSQLWQLYKDSNILKKMDEYEEDKEIYEQDGEELDLDET